MFDCFEIFRKNWARCWIERGKYVSDGLTHDQCYHELYTILHDILWVESSHLVAQTFTKFSTFNNCLKETKKIG